MDFFAGRRHLQTGAEHDHICPRRKRPIRQTELKAVVGIVREIEAIQINGRIARVDQLNPVREPAVPVCNGGLVAAHPLRYAQRRRLIGDIALISGAPIRRVGITRRCKRVRL